MLRFPHRVTETNYSLSNILALMGVFILAYIVITFFLVFSDAARGLVGEAFQLILCILATWVALVRSPSMSPLIRRSWSFLTTCFVFWSGSLAYSVGASLIYGSQIPSPSLADIFLLAGYAALLIGVVQQTHHAQPHFGDLRVDLDVLISSSAFTTLVGLFFVGPILTGIKLSFRDTFWTLVYPLLDLFILGAIVNIRLIATNKASRITLALIATGLLLFLFSDISSAFAKFHPLEFEQSVAVVNSGWVIGFCMMALLAIFAKQIQQDEPEPVQARRSLGDQIQPLLPLATTIILVWATVVYWQLGDVLSYTAAIISGGCLILLILRQGVIAGEVELSRYAILVNSAPEPSFICDDHGRMLVANPALLSAVGFAADTLPNHIRLDELSGDPVIARKILTEAIRCGWSGEISLRQTNGAPPRPVHLALQPAQGWSGRTSLLAGTAHDLSETKRQQAVLQQAFDEVAAAQSQLQEFNANLEKLVAEKTTSLSQALARLEQQNLALQKMDEMKSDFVSLVSHELRAPLTNISSGIELVLEDPKKIPASTFSTLNLVQAEIHRLADFVETILDVSSLDAGRTPFSLVPTSLTKVVKGLQKQLSSSPDFSRIKWGIPIALPLVLADERPLESILLQLIDNAAKYAPEGDIEIEFHPSLDDRINIDVCDSGPGIPPDRLPLLFEKFYRVQQGDSQSVYGHGLGLYTARKLLQAMGGDICAENRPQGGARFTFWLISVRERDDPENLNR